MPDLSTLLNQAAQIEREATPGPWSAHGQEMRAPHRTLPWEVVISDCEHVSTGAGVVREADNRLIALLRNIAPDLFAVAKAAAGGVYCADLDGEPHGAACSDCVEEMRSALDRLALSLERALEGGE